jgi:hypothetical protein
MLVWEVSRIDEVDVVFVVVVDALSEHPSRHAASSESSKAVLKQNFITKLPVVITVEVIA